MRKNKQNQYLKIKIWKEWMINILMCVNIFLGETTIYLRILIYLAKKSWALWINKYENLHYWKRQENQ